MPTELPYQPRKTLSAMHDFNVFPNIFEKALPEDQCDESDEPYDKAVEFGYDTPIFLKNGGTVLCQTIILACILPLAMLLMKCKKAAIAGFFADIVSAYRWSFFIRAWICMYLNL